MYGKSVRARDGRGRPGSKDWTRLSGRHVAARCVGGRHPLVLGAYRVNMPGSVPGFIEKAPRPVRDAGPGPGPGPVLPGRESFAAGTIRAPGVARVGYPVPCRNAGSAVAALRESARNSRPGASTVAAGGRNPAGHHVKTVEGKERGDPSVPGERRARFGPAAPQPAQGLNCWLSPTKGYHVGLGQPPRSQRKGLTAGCLPPKDITWVWASRPAASARGCPRRRGTWTPYGATGPMGAKTGPPTMGPACRTSTVPCRRTTGGRQCGPSFLEGAAGTA